MRSIIKDWTKLRDWELGLLEQRGYEQAIIEKARRAHQSLCYQMPNGDWAATAMGVTSNGFPTKQASEEWIAHRFQVAKGE